MSESRPSQRFLNPTVPAVRGKIYARRRSIPTAGGSVEIPKKINFGIIKNTGSNSFVINFNSDEITDYWTVNPGEQTPTLMLRDLTIINAKAISGPTIAEAIFWG